MGNTRQLILVVIFGILAQVMIARDHIYTDY